VADPTLETLDALLKLLEREVEKGPGLPELLVKVLAILGMAPLNADLDAFGNQLNVASQVFDEDARVPTEIGDLLLEPPGRLSQVLPHLGDLLLEPRGRLSEVLPHLGEVPAKPLGSRGRDSFDSRERLGVHRCLRLKRKAV